MSHDYIIIEETEIETQESKVSVIIFLSLQ